MKLALLALLLLVPFVAGCMGTTGVPLPPDQASAVRDQFEELDRMSRSEIDDHLKTLQTEIAGLENTKDRTLRSEMNRKKLYAAYCWERRGDFSDAEARYNDVANTEYGSVAHFRIAQIAEYVGAQSKAQQADASLPSERRLEAGEIEAIQHKKAQQALERGANYPVGTRGLLRTPPVASLTPASWELVDMRYECYQRLDGFYRDKPAYKAFDFLVRIGGGPERNSSYVLAIVLIAVLAKLITTPLSAAQFRSMRSMQKVQPEIKKLQEKYKDDKQQLAKAQMELFREAKVNPFSSCLPMLIQMPILIYVYYGIRYFVYRFWNVHFLYIANIANPDVVSISGVQFPGPMLLLYGLSMYFSQKLIQTPAATPEQEQQQKMMAYMMPVMFVFILKSLPAAFILYWLLQNILMTGHQYMMMRSGAVQAAPAGGPALTPPSKPQGPPPEALERLTKGSQKSKKKRKKY